MVAFSRHFGLGKSQAELDFVDVELQRDTRLFVDPFAISQGVDTWTRDAHSDLVSYFQRLVDLIREGRNDQALDLMTHLREPNETRLGMSSGRPAGAGIGDGQADDLLKALTESSAVQIGLITSMEECELMVDGIGRDKISDLTTNVLRGRLVEYTQEQCALHGVAMQSAPLPPVYDPETATWRSDYHMLPVADGAPVLLVPKAIVRIAPAYDHQSYYQHNVLNFLQAEHLNANDSLVRGLRGRRFVTKKDLEAKYPRSKEFLFRFSKEHPEVLAQYREDLARLEVEGRAAVVTPDDEAIIARSLIDALRAIPGGPDRASAYHSLMIGIIELLFHPKLSNPQKEREIHDGRKRIDIMMENSAKTGIFDRLHSVRRIPCNYIPFECKNYTREIANPELDQMIGRFSVRRGEVGVICCRQFEDRALFLSRCRDALNDGRGVIIALDDDTVIRLLQLVSDGRRPDLEGEFVRLFDEVFLG